MHSCAGFKFLIPLCKLAEVLSLVVVKLTLLHVVESQLFPYCQFGFLIMISLTSFAVKIFM